MAKHFIDKIETSDDFVVADKTSLKALKFIKNESGWTVIAKKVIKDEINLKIPTFYKRQAVTEIGKYAFKDCTGIISVIIPGTVTVIEEEAFYNCNAMQFATVKGESQLVKICNSAFNGCTLLGRVVIPKTVESIGKECFYYCYKLKSVTIEEDSALKIIAPWAFYDCKLLMSINLEMAKKLETISKSAFLNCVQLTEVIIPEEVIDIHNMAFHNCRSLNKATFLGKNSWSVRGKAISEEVFKNPTLMARYLKEDYVSENWNNLIKR